MPPPTGIKNVHDRTTSNRPRAVEHWIDGKKVVKVARPLLDPKPAKGKVKATPKTKPVPAPVIPPNSIIINRNVADRWTILSFHYPVPVRYVARENGEGHVLLSFQLFHIQKCNDPVWRQRFLDRTAGGDAMSAAWLASRSGMIHMSAVLNRDEKDMICIGRHWTPDFAKRVMWSMLRLKFANPIAKRALLDTGTKNIYAAMPANWYWECDVPMDLHERMLMQLRTKLAAAESR